jgi:hypothetical protein
VSRSQRTSEKSIRDFQGDLRWTTCTSIQLVVGSQIRSRSNLLIIISPEWQPLSLSHTQSAPLLFEPGGRPRNTRSSVAHRYRQRDRQKTRDANAGLAFVLSNYNTYILLSYEKWEISVCLLDTYNSISSPGHQSSCWQDLECSSQCKHARYLFFPQCEGFLFVSTSPPYPLHGRLNETALSY